jgi:hypothetical protein
MAYKRSEAAILADARTMRILVAVDGGRVRRGEGGGTFAEYDLAGQSIKLSVHFLAEEGLLELHPAGPPTLSAQAAALVRAWSEVGGLAS